MNTVLITERNNASPAVAKAILELQRCGGGELRFDGGEYHFHEAESAEADILNVVNSELPHRHVAFYLKDCENITVNGNGSTFIIHEFLSPFFLENSKNIVLTDFHLTTAARPYASMTVLQKDEDGFTAVIDCRRTDYTVQDGHLEINADGVMHSTAHQKFSLHSLKKLSICYLLAGDTEASTEQLAAACVDTDASPCPDGIRFTYRTGNKKQCPYDVGEEVVINLEEPRHRCVCIIDRCRDIVLKDVTIHRGGGMGVVAQLCENVELNGYRLHRDEDDLCTLTADAMYFVNCKGLLRVCNGHIAHSLDDGINVHGMYHKVTAVEKDQLTVVCGHVSQIGFQPYQIGDVLNIIEPERLSVIGEAVIRQIFPSEQGATFVLSVTRTGDCFPDCLVENTDAHPNVELVNNTFFDYPNIRLIGGGHILIENNVFENGSTGLASDDLNRYWFEAGRLCDLTVRNNIYRCTAKQSKKGIFRIGAAGFDPSDTPAIHDRVTICNNQFFGVQGLCINASGVRHLAIADNLSDGRPLTAQDILIDGKNRLPNEQESSKDETV